MKEQTGFNKERRGVIYARVSTREQQDGYSIDAQVKLLREYGEKNGIVLLREFIEVESASKAGRQNFENMVEFLKQEAKKKTGCRIVLVEKTDRLTRNIKDYVTIDELIQEHSMEIHLVKENEMLSSNSNSHQKLIHGIKVLLAKNYSDNLSEEVGKGMKEKANQGFYPSLASLGYKNVRNGTSSWIEVDPNYSTYVKQLFELYATGEYSILKLSKHMKREGMVSRKGNEISTATFYRMLRNPIYYGEFYWSGKYYPGKHEAIISKELWLQVQVRLDQNHKKAGRPSQGILFGKLIVCGHCGCLMTAEQQKGHIYYHCTGQKGKHGEKWVREEEVDLQIFEAIKTLSFDDSETLSFIVQTLKEFHGQKKKEHNEALTRLHSQYKRIQNRIDQLYEDKLDGEISREEYREKKTKWEIELQKVRKQIEAIENQNKDYLENASVILDLTQKAAYAYEGQAKEGKQKLIKILFSNLSWKGGELIATFAEPFDIIRNINKNRPQGPVNIKTISAKNKIWWRRRESNPRPKTVHHGYLHVYPAI